MKVSIITPFTPDREYLMRRLEKCVESQTYKDVEWLKLSSPGSIGAKRNQLCHMSTGDLIVHFDSDDHYSPDYIEKAVLHMKLTSCDISGVNSCYFADLENKKAWVYTYTGRQPYVIGSGMIYKRAVWERSNFQDINEGEDMHFITNAGRINGFDGMELFYATIHGSNTCSHKSIKAFKEQNFDIFAKTFKL